MLQKIENAEGFVKDSETQAILSTDMNALKAYKKKRKKNDQLEADINNIRNELNEVKTLLLQLLEKDK